MRAFFYIFCFLGISLWVHAQDSTQSALLPDSALPLKAEILKPLKADTIYQKDTIVVRDTIVIDNSADSLNNASTLKSITPNLEPPEIGNIISGGKIFWSIVICILAYFLIRLITLIIERFAERSTHHRITLKSISPIVRIVSWILVIFIIVEGVFQPPMSTIIAALASIGIAIGFAAQDILKNIFGGIMILLDRPFHVGDKIEVGNYYGEVKEIGLRSTRIITKDDSLVSVPNAEVVNTAVSNSNAGEANCQVVAEIYLPIDVDTDKVRQIAKEAAQVSRYIYLNKPIAVIFVNEVKEKRSYLKMRLKAYVSDIRYEFAFQSDMTELVLRDLLDKKIIKKEELL